MQCGVLVLVITNLLGRRKTGGLLAGSQRLCIVVLSHETY